LTGGLSMVTRATSPSRLTFAKSDKQNLRAVACGSPPRDWIYSAVT
jgi:hypothetical protein